MRWKRRGGGGVLVMGEVLVLMYVILNYDLKEGLLTASGQKNKKKSKHKSDSNRTGVIETREIRMLIFEKKTNP